MNKIYSTFVFALILSFTGAALAEEPFLVYAAKRVSQAPVIDGVGSDACWQETEKTFPFVAIGGKKVALQTRGMLCWDRKNLYIAFICEEPLIDILKERIRKGLVPSFEESIEIFIDSNYDRYTYLQFRVGISGERDSRRGHKIDAKLNKKWSGAVSLNRNNWTVEAAIPFNCLGGRPSSEAIWGLNMNRQRMIEIKGKWICWSDTKGGFQSPARFGHLIFVNYPTWLKAYLGNQINSLNRETKTLLRRYPKVTVSFRDRSGHLKKEYQNFLRRVSAANIDSGDKCAPFYTEGKSIVDRYENVLSELRLLIIQGQFQ